MTLKEIFKNFQFSFFSNYDKKKELNYLKRLSIIIYPSIFLVTLIIYITTYNSIINQKKEDQKNLENFINSEEFNNIKTSFFEKLKSPYLEFSYKIENNDSIGKILKKFRISDNEVQKIIEGLKKKKLTNIYAGRELIIVLKKLDNENNSIVNILYPINNT